VKNLYNKNLIQVFEHQRVTTPNGKYPLPTSLHYGGEFSNSLLERFEEYHEGTNTPFFKLIRNGVQFTEYVGAIRVGNITVEVLPKADKNEDETGLKKWHDMLLSMLKRCKLLQAKQSGEADLKIRSNSILELYFELFINELDYLIRRGLIKRYNQVEGNRTALKGALVFSKNLTYNLVRQERFFVRYSQYNKNHLLHQILNEALLVINQLNSSSLLGDKIGRVLLNFPEVKRKKITSKDFEIIKETRKTAPYQTALKIAELILLNYRPDIQSGNRNLLAIMFDMNLLWEEYIYRIMVSHSNKFNVYRQNKETFWNNRTVRPDIVLEDKITKERIILDTKWKVIDENYPSIGDLHQMFVYHRIFKAEKTILIYPGKEVSTRYGVYNDTLVDKPLKCKVGYVDVLDKSFDEIKITEHIENELIPEKKRNAD